MLPLPGLELLVEVSFRVTQNSSPGSAARGLMTINDDYLSNPFVWRTKQKRMNKQTKKKTPRKGVIRLGRLLFRNISATGALTGRGTYKDLPGANQSERREMSSGNRSSGT